MYLIFWCQFRLESHGQFEMESSGQFKLELGGQYHWNFQISIKNELISFTACYFYLIHLFKSAHFKTQGFKPKKREYNNTYVK